MNKHIPELVMVAVLSVIHTGVRAAAFTNGSFETANTGVARPVCAGGASVCIQYNAGDTFIDGWTVVSGSVDLVGTVWVAADGVRSLDLNGTAAGVISQVFDTVAGTPYEVRFAVSGNGLGAPTIKNARATAGATTYDFSFDTTGHTVGDMGWTEHLFMFTASGASSTLTFSSLTGGSAGIALDHVRVAAVPLPASLPLFAAGLLGLARRRKRKSKRVTEAPIILSRKLLSLRQRRGSVGRGILAIAVSLALGHAAIVWAPKATALGTTPDLYEMTLLVQQEKKITHAANGNRFNNLLADIFFPDPVAGEVVSLAQFDPYFAFRLDLTNTGTTPQGFLIIVSSPMVPVLNPLPGADPAMFTVLSTAELFDANGNGSASFGSLDVGFGLSNGAPSAGSGPLIPPQFTTLNAPGLQTIFDVGPTPVPASPAGQWDTMTYFINGFFGPLSPGDRVVLEVFGCVALPGTACPAPPDLSAIPLPAAVWFLAPALAGLAACAHRQRNR